MLSFPANERALTHQEKWTRTRNKLYIRWLNDVFGRYMCLPEWKPCIWEAWKQDKEGENGYDFRLRATEKNDGANFVIVSVSKFGFHDLSELVDELTCWRFGNYHTCEYPSFLSILLHSHSTPGYVNMTPFLKLPTFCWRFFLFVSRRSVFLSSHITDPISLSITSSDGFYGPSLISRLCAWAARATEDCVKHVRQPRRCRPESRKNRWHSSAMK